MRRMLSLFRNRFVIKCFLSLLTFLMAVIGGFMIYLRFTSTKTMQREYISYSEIQTERITVMLDDNFKSCVRVAALLYVDNMSKLYLFSEDADQIFPNLYSSVQNKLLSYKESFSEVDSIYLFPAYDKGVFLTHNSEMPTSINFLSDDNCLRLQEIPDKISFVSRRKNNIYPYLVTFYMPIYENEKMAAIVLNIDVSKIPVLLDNETNSFQEIYIVSEEGEIIYREGQKNIPEELNEVPELINFDNTKDKCSKYVNAKKPYIYVQEHSALYDWYYITITEPQSYIGKSYDFFSDFLFILPWIVFFVIVIVLYIVRMLAQPIHVIMEFMDNPMLVVPEHITQSESRKIIEQLIAYIQRNENLSKELDRQMEHQNEVTYYALQTQINPHFLFNTLNLIRSLEIETLGFEHKVPELTLALSRFLKYVLGANKMESLKTEIHYLEFYLKILNYRYMEKIQILMELDKACEKIMVPKLVLQPLVENAVFHGCASLVNIRDTCIWVKIKRENNICKISVKDNGNGMAPEFLEELKSDLSEYEEIPTDSIGIKNVSLRMFMIYGKEFKITVNSNLGEGTEILLTFPFYSSE